jgi:hypothetical protein
MSRSGIRFDPGCGIASRVISIPNGKPSSAEAEIDETDVSTSNATPAALHANLTDPI